MAQTVIGVFGSDLTAGAAVQHLLSVGVERSDIHIHSRPAEIEAMANSAVAPDGTPRHQSESLLDKIERFFAMLVGEDGRPPEFHHYREVVRRGGALVSVCVTDDSQLPIVFTIFETSGALDIDEHAAQWETDLQENAELASRQASAPAEKDDGTEATDQPGAQRQAYRIYPRVPEADTSPPTEESGRQ